ncbi:MAG: hypothetical protein FJ164_03525 [Gammaproteobacteria bacterium]|nr:hypothetical protein [Gammaproteobacteria bacterium]
MHNRFQTRLLFPVQPSRRTQGTLRAVHGMAVLGVLLALPWSWQLVPSLALLGVSAVFTERELLAAAQRYQLRELAADGHWFCLASTGERQPAGLTGHPFMLGRLAILPIRAGGKRYTIALDATNTAADDLRRLKVRLRLEPAVTAAAS